MLTYIVYLRWLRQHPKVLSMSFKPEVKRAEKSNAIDAFVTGTVGKDMSIDQWESYYKKVQICVQSVIVRWV